MHIIVGLLFVLHTVGLIARWYISGHALGVMPTIDLYNALAMFFGLAFDRKSKLTVASSFVGSRFYLHAF
jgi:hypothetical protein